MCFSSHSAAWGVIASAVKARAISWIWRCSSVRSNWLIITASGERMAGWKAGKCRAAASFIAPAVEEAPAAARRVARMDGDPLEDAVAPAPGQRPAFDPNHRSQGPRPAENQVAGRAPGRG